MRLSASPNALALNANPRHGGATSAAPNHSQGAALPSGHRSTHGGRRPSSRSRRPRKSLDLGARSPPRPEVLAAPRPPPRPGTPVPVGSDKPQQAVGTAALAPRCSRPTGWHWPGPERRGLAQAVLFVGSFSCLQGRGLSPTSNGAAGSGDDRLVGRHGLIYTASRACHHAATRIALRGSVAAWSPRSQNRPVISTSASRITGSSTCSFGAC
jgi:hypothetical protein